MHKPAVGLDQCDLFTDLNPMELQEVTKLTTKTSYHPGDVIAELDNDIPEIFVVLYGTVDIVSLKGVSLYHASTGEMFGESAAVRGLRKTGRAVAREECQVLSLPLNHLDNIGIENPGIVKAIEKNIMHSLAVRLARMQKLVELLKSELARAVKRQGE